jgi:hypothetical protein
MTSLEYLIRRPHYLEDLISVPHYLEDLITRLLEDLIKRPHLKSLQTSRASEPEC